MNQFTFTVARLSRMTTISVVAGLMCSASLAQLSGDVGVGAYRTSAIVRGDPTRTTVLPYGYVDYGPAFWRVDTVGVKTLPMGQGFLELAGRISMEGFQPNAQLPGIRERRNPVPVGLGTFQTFGFGGVFLNAFYNLQGKHGALLEATYAGRLSAGAVTFYPTLGLEHRSAQYVRGLYGTDATEAAAQGKPAYAPGASTVPVLGLSASLPISDNWAFTAQYRRRWLDAAIRNSPLVDKATQDSAYVALVYQFK